VVDELGREAVSATYRYLRENHPGLIPALANIEDRLTSKIQFNREWEYELPEVSLYRKEDSDLNELRDFYERSSWVREFAFLKYWPLGVFGTLLAVAAFVMGFEHPVVLRWQYEIVGILSYSLASRWYTIIFDQPDEGLGKKFFQLVEDGLFRHEVLASLVLSRDEHKKVGSVNYTENLLDPLTTIETLPPTDLAIWNSAHVQRVIEEEELDGAKP
jgi:hypothetical protein